MGKWTNIPANNPNDGKVAEVKDAAPNKVVEGELFSGTARTLVYKPWQGFADYAVATLTIEQGVVTKVELSDPYAGFEALAKLELENSRHLEKLRKNYPPEFRHV